MVKLTNRARIVIDALCRNRFTDVYADNKNVLIVFQQIFGDSVILQSVLAEYLKLFPKDEGYSIKLLARPSVLKFMKANLVLPDEIEYEELDFKKFLEDYNYYKKTVEKYRNAASTLIVPGTSLSAEIFSTANNAKRKVGLVRCKDVTKPYIYKLFYELAYTERVRPGKEDMMLQRHRLLVHYLGDKEYKAKLPTAVKHEKVIEDSSYIVMCPGSSKMEKCWPIQRFAEVADYLIEHYNMNIHLCGGADEVHFKQELLKFVNHKERIISHIGKTNFADWSAIVEYADLVIGNDSATLHLAAIHHRKAICIAGVYDKYQFFPYKVDELDEGDRLPVTILKDMPCEYCRTIGYDAGYGNMECTQRIKANQCALCIAKISTEEVISKVDELMAEEVAYGYRKLL